MQCNSEQPSPDRFGKGDVYYMQQALKQAWRAYDKEEVPIGAVVVAPDGTIIARAHNQVEKKGCQTAHAEVLAIAKACKKLGDWRLQGCWLYVTLEPCAMCMHLLLLSRLEGLVYGADSPLFGYHLDKYTCFAVYKKFIITLVKGVEAKKIVQLLKHFFHIQRKRRSGVEGNKTNDKKLGRNKTKVGCQKT